MVKININIDLDKYHLFFKKRDILEAKNIKELKRLVKSKITPTNKDIKVFLLHFTVNPKSKYPLSLSCSQYTINTNSILTTNNNDSSHTILWTKENLLEFGFKKSHLNNIFDAFKNNSISFNDNETPICEIIKCKKKSKTDDTDVKKINSILKTEQYHIFYRNKELKPLSHKTISGVQNAIKQNVNPSKTDKKIYLVKIRHIPDTEKKYILISCCRNTISPKLLLTKKNDDDCFTILYSKKEYDKFGFDISHIKKIINKIKKDELDIEFQFINISSILEDI